MLARKLGVRPPSLYVHIKGLADLRRRLAARGARQLAAAMQTAAAGRARGDALTAVADAYRSYAREHPGSYAALQRAPDPDDAEATAAGAEAVDVVLAGYAATVSSRTTRFTPPASSAPPSTDSSRSRPVAASVSRSTSTKPSPGSRTCSTKDWGPRGRRSDIGTSGAYLPGNPAGSRSLHASKACVNAALLVSTDEPFAIPSMVTSPVASGSGNALIPLAGMH